MFRLLQLTVLGYVVGYSLLYMKTYQAVDSPIGAVMTKNKNNAITCLDTSATLDSCDPDLYRVWDPIDYTIPPQER